MQCKTSVRFLMWWRQVIVAKFQRDALHALPDRMHAYYGISLTGCNQTGDQMYCKRRVEANKQARTRCRRDSSVQPQTIHFHHGKPCREQSPLPAGNEGWLGGKEQGKGLERGTGSWREDDGGKHPSAPITLTDCFLITL